MSGSCGMKMEHKHFSKRKQKMSGSYSLEYVLPVNILQNLFFDAHELFLNEGIAARLSLATHISHGL